MAGLTSLKGITDKQIDRLKEAGVRGTAKLLTWGSTPDGRREIARAAKIPIQRVANWVQRADLMRVKGVNDDYARLLARAGVEDIADLSTRNPAVLAGEVEIASAVERDVKRLPSKAMIGKWIEQARLMIRHVWYHDTWGDEAVTGRRPPAVFPAPRV
jgi:predicted flap endonuclease-1-like 5' DNA nuclease